MNPAIIVMCKAPVAGKVKTRLAPFLSAEKSADLAGCFAVDAAAKAARICPNVIIAYAGEKNLLAKILPPNLIWTEQKGADLGERMHNALGFAFEENFAPLVVIGTDSPTLPLEFPANAISILSENCADVVLGKTEDGGYYLVGLREPEFGIFQNVVWSSAETFAKTARNIEQLNLHLELLPAWYDVDEPEDLKRLKVEIEHLSGARKLAPATAAWIEENSALFS